MGSRTVFFASLFFDNSSSTVAFSPSGGATIYSAMHEWLEATAHVTIQIVASDIG